jgi:hypothetical protein
MVMYCHMMRRNALVRRGVCGKRSRVVTMSRTISARRLRSDGMGYSLPHQVPPPRPILLTHNLRDDFAMTRSDVKVNVDDLLPCAERELSAEEWNDE